MRHLILVLGIALSTLLAGSPVRADEPKTKPALTEKQWQEFVDKLNPLGFIQRMREAQSRQRASDNLKEIGKALQAYQAQQGQQPIPPSWIQQLLPYIEQDNLYSLYSLTGSGNRLGARWEQVSEAMRSQLGLAANKGVLITEVDSSAAAAKAGFKKFDILLQLDGKDVTDKDFQEILNKAPEKKEITARVMRGGKEVEVKGITLPAAGPMPVRTYICPTSPLSGIRDGTSNTLIFPYADGSVRNYVPNAWTWPNATPLSDVQSKILTTTFRQEDRFTARYQEGSLIITVTGQIKKDTAEVKTVKVIDGAVEHRYESIDKTPEEYRDKARDLLKAAEKNQDRIEIQKGARTVPFGDW